MLKLLPFIQKHMSAVYNHANAPKSTHSDMYAYATPCDTERGTGWA